MAAVDLPAAVAEDWPGVDAADYLLNSSSCEESRRMTSESHTTKHTIEFKLDVTYVR